MSCENVCNTAEAKPPAVVGMELCDAKLASHTTADPQISPDSSNSNMRGVMEVLLWGKLE
jgi:hypothetical protein